ncbi:TonB-dependent receptor [Flaviaesturariibacter flavus]|uniref:TonB-dependent receptor n=1 Tax=Flaviaesturariibacter flavus TaxID=2502780 RepID=A0A4R1BMV1_9BACT|nr:outer membrane beta-barrel family protein [Flaviaesturariibacter flavus]TCJ18769.1 TonB-dependent receptor [Flaviaesturariibacter flavus]
MRKILALLLLTATAGAVQAQTVSGRVQDADGKPLQGVTVSLLRDSSVVKLAVSDASGAYQFGGISAGRYRVSASSVGFSPAPSAPFEAGTGTTELPVLALRRASGELAGVTVAVRKPIVEVKADRTVVNVEGTINATGNDALELLRKSPGVLVDKDENLSVSGKTGVQVYVDGRPTPLSGADLAAYLRTMQSTQIEAIEIISNPGAKYEAAGNAGIINIRLKKNKNYGANGSLTAGYNVGHYSKYNAGASLNYRNNKVNLYGNYNFNYGRMYNTMDLHRDVRDSIFDQKGRNVFTNNSHGFKAGADYTINKRHSVGVLVNGNLAAPQIAMESRTPIISKATGVTDRILTAQSNSEVRRNNINANANYNYNGTKGQSLVLNADYGWYDNNTDQRQPNVYWTPDGSKLSSAEYRFITPTRIDIASLKADWEQNFAKGKLGFGGKTAYTSTDNDFRRFNVNGPVENYDRDLSNRFRYDEQIHAGYVNYNRQLKGLMIQGGLRVEHTVSKGTSNGEKNESGTYRAVEAGFQRDYTDFFPSAAISFNKNPMKVWSINYSRRIDRPAYQDLNPFEFRLDEYTYSKGNTNLRPQYTNSIGISHSYKYKFNASLNWSHVQNMFAQQIDVDGSKSFITKQNLATQDVIALNASYPFMYKSFTSFVNVSTNYSKYHSPGATPDRTIDFDAFALTAFSQNSLKFGKDKTWTGEMTAFYNAPTIYQGAFQARAMGAVDFGLQKTILQGQGTIKASVSDVFQTLRFSGYTQFAGQRTDVAARWESRQFKLNATWRFGNKQVKAAKQRNVGAEDELKRTQGGGGGIGIGG